MRSFTVSVMRQKSLRSVGLRSTSVRAEQRFTEPLAPLVKCVAVWVLMLKHIQAPHTDALKTHFTQNISAALLECEKSIRKQRENVDKSPDVGAFQDSRFFNKGKGIPSYGVALGCVVEPISVLSIAAIQQKHFVTSGL